MAFRIKGISNDDRIDYVSIQDPAIDWDATEAAGLSIEDYLDSRNKTGLVYVAGEKPTVFTLKPVPPRLAGIADQRAHGFVADDKENTGFFYEVCRLGIAAIEGLEDEHGKPIEANFHGTDLGQTLDYSTLDHIPRSVAVELTAVIIDMSTAGVDFKKKSKSESTTNLTTIAPQPSAATPTEPSESGRVKITDAMPRASNGV